MITFFGVKYFLIFFYRFKGYQETVENLYISLFITGATGKNNYTIPEILY